MAACMSIFTGKVMVWRGVLGVLKAIITVIITRAVLVNRSSFNCVGVLSVLVVVMIFGFYCVWGVELVSPDL